MDFNVDLFSALTRSGQGFYVFQISEGLCLSIEFVIQS